MICYKNNFGRETIKLKGGRKMKKTVLILTMGFLLIGVNAFAGGDLIVEGKVGIGTPTPGATLDVRGSAVFNEDGANADFRIGGDTNPNLFYVEAAEDAVGIGDKPSNVWGIKAFSVRKTGNKMLLGGVIQANAEPTADTNLPFVGLVNRAVYSASSGTISLIGANPLVGSLQQVWIATRGGTHTFTHPVAALSAEFSTRDNNFGTVNITDAIGIYFRGWSSENTGSGPTNITNLYGAKIDNSALQSYSRVSVTNQYGLYIAKQARGTLTNAGLILAGDGAGADIVFGPNQDVRLYSKSDNKLYANDGINETQVSPHDPETNEWIFYSKNIKTGVIKRVDMERLVKAVEKITGEKFMVETME